MKREDSRTADFEDAKALNLSEKLRKAGLRPTRQRQYLANLLFSKGNRHVSAEALHEEALEADVPVSLATVYNTLHQFHEAGLLRAVAVESSKTYFDTNVTDHHHFYIEDENRIVDMPTHVSIGDIPEPPDGMEISKVDVIVRLRKARKI